MKLNQNNPVNCVYTKYAISTTKGCINETTDMIGDISQHDFDECPWSPVDITIDLIEYHEDLSVYGLVEAARVVIGIEALINAYADGDVSLTLLTTPNGVASKVVIDDLFRYNREYLSDALMRVVSNIILEATDEFIRVRINNPWLNDSPVSFPIPGGPRKLVGVDRVSFQKSIRASKEIREFCDIVTEAVFTVFDEIEPMND